MLFNFFTSVIGITAGGDWGTIGMVMEMGLILIIPALFLNSYFIIAAFFVKEKWAKFTFCYLTVFISALILVMSWDTPWTTLAIFLALLVSTSITYHWVR